MNANIGLTYELYRGMHSRVANRLGLSRSYVWRVANGERRSPAVEAALEKELARIRARARKLFHPARNGRRNISDESKLLS